jgi:hypothetical protein
MENKTLIYSRASEAPKIYRERAIQFNSSESPKLPYGKS